MPSLVGMALKTMNSGEPACIRYEFKDENENDIEHEQLHSEYEIYFVVVLTQAHHHDEDGLDDDVNAHQDSYKRLYDHCNAGLRAAVALDES